jgi:hypothetical protein
MDVETGVQLNDSCPYLVFSVLLLRWMVPNLPLGGGGGGGGGGGVAAAVVVVVVVVV